MSNSNPNIPHRRRPLDQRAYQITPQLGIDVQDVCSQLPLLRAQYFKMIGAAATREIRDGERWKAFHPGNAAALKREITRLEILCRSYGDQARAIRAGPARPLFGYRGYSNPYRYF